MTKLAEMKKALEAATPGPWYEDDRGDEVEIVGKGNNCERFGVPGEWTVATVENDIFDEDPVPARANAHLIANAPEWIAKLLKVVESADYLHRARAALVDAHSDPEGMLSACYSGGWKDLTKALEELK